MDKLTFQVQPLAIKKAYLHCLRYLTDDVTGVLVGKVNGNEVVEIVDAYPLFHSRVLSPGLESALEIIESIISEEGLKIVGLYESPINQIEDVTVYASDIGIKILEKIYENNLAEPVFIKIFNMKESGDGNQDYDETQILGSIISKHTKKGGDDLGFKKLLASAQSGPYFELVKQNIANSDYRKIVDFDAHLEDISLDFTNSFLQ